METEAKDEKSNQIHRQKDLTSKAQSTESGLMYYVEKQGSGAKPNHGETLKVHYSLRLNDGEQLDSSYDRNERSEEHTSELQSRGHLVCRLLLEKKKI